MPVASVFSIQNGNMGEEVLFQQDRIVHKFLPEGWTFTQVFQPFGGEPHSIGMHRCVEMCTTDVIVFLDTDCIPLTPGALPYLYDFAQKGVLAGIIQRSNHLQNNQHVYVSAACMAFSKQKYAALGSPAFFTTGRGDVGEELTYVWEKDDSKSIHMIRPTASDDMRWDLDKGQRPYGVNTTYGDLFFHAWEGRTPVQQTAFVNRCKQID
jgi:hypothetical protein